MKRIFLFAAGCTALAAAVFYAAPFQTAALFQAAAPFQTAALFQTAPARPLAALAPGGALLYLESPDFARELRDWNQSPEKQAWLAGANYAEFSRSMLFLRLTEEWKAFGGAAGFAADLPMLASIAGKRSAVALYDIGQLQFLYISEVPEAEAMQTALWRARAQYEPRAAAGIPFYVRREEGHTVAFAASGGYLLLATREEALAGALRLLSGEKAPAVADDPWYAESVRAAKAPGELRLVMNLEAVLKTHQFRSHWIHENTPSLREYWAGISDIHRSAGEIREDRILLRRTPQPAPDSVAALARLAPDDAGFYRAGAVGSADQAVAEILRKLLPPRPNAAYWWEQAPDVAPGVTATPDAGAEGDLETRIDEPPMERRDQFSAQPLTAEMARAGVKAYIEAQANRAAVGGVFRELPCALAFQATGAWDDSAVRASLTTGLDNQWSASGLGLHWVEQRRNGMTWHELDGLAHLAVATRGDLLIVGSSGAMVAAMLERAGRPAGAVPPATSIAEFRHAQEQPNFELLTGTLDRTNSRSGMFRPDAQPFFSANLTSLGVALNRVSSAAIAVNDRGDTVEQTVTYRLR
jgi:hypothetical protein